MTPQHAGAALDGNATYCNILQHTVTHCNTLQRRCNTQEQHLDGIQDAEIYCNTLQHTATHCKNASTTSQHAGAAFGGYAPAVRLLVDSGADPGEVLQWCCSGVAVVFQWCSSGVAVWGW